MEHYGHLVAPSDVDNQQAQTSATKNIEAYQIPSYESLSHENMQSLAEKTNDDSMMLKQLVVDVLKYWRPGQKIALSGVCVTRKAFDSLVLALDLQGWLAEDLGFPAEANQDMEGFVISELSPRVSKNDDPDRQIYELVISAKL